MGQLERQWQKLGSFVGCITEHDALITGTQLFESLLITEPLSNVGRLLFNCNQDVAGLVIKPLVRMIVANVLDRIADNFLVVEMRLRGDLAKDHYHAWC